MGAAFQIEVEPDGSEDSGPCECCGNVSRRVWGFAFLDGDPFAGYFVHWTLGHVLDRGAIFDLIVGKWGQSATAADRCAVSLTYRITESGAAFMVIDANERDTATSTLVSRALKRTAVVGESIAPKIYAACDAVLMDDDRLPELRDGLGSDESQTSAP